MDCERIWDLLSRYSDGEATSEEAAIVEAHVSVCVSCARDLAFLRNTSAALAAIPRVEPPPALQSAILAATIYKLTWRERVARAARRIFEPLPVRYGMVAAAGAAVALTVTVMRHPGVLFIPSTSPISVKPRVIAEAPNTPSVTAHPETVQPPSQKVTRHTPPLIRQNTSIEPAIIASVRREARGVPHLKKRTSPVVAPSEVASKALPVAGGMPDLKTKMHATESNEEHLDRSPLPEEKIMASSAPVLFPTKSAPPSEHVDMPEAAPNTRNTAVVLTAASNVEILAGQVATLADLRRDLRRRAENRPPTDYLPTARPGEIRIDVFRSSF